MEKQRRIKILSLSAVIVAVLGLTVAFAALSTTLNIKGSAYLDAAKWGIKFQNLSEPSIVGEASDAKTANQARYDVTCKNASVNKIAYKIGNGSYVGLDSSSLADVVLFEESDVTRVIYFNLEYDTY
jgi:anti-sigma28 factor (negative regulator of flagellin synthesis)